MIYKVIANHLINVDLGVVGYLPDGMRFWIWWLTP